MPRRFRPPPSRKSAPKSAPAKSPGQRKSWARSRTRSTRRSEETKSDQQRFPSLLSFFVFSPSGCPDLDRPEMHLIPVLLQENRALGCDAEAGIFSELALRH